MENAVDTSSIENGATEPGWLAEVVDAAQAFLPMLAEHPVAAALAVVLGLVAVFMWRGQRAKRRAEREAARPAAFKGEE